MLGESQPLTQKAKVEYTVGEAVTALGTGITMLFAGNSLGKAVEAKNAESALNAAKEAEQYSKDAEAVLSMKTVHNENALKVMLGKYDNGGPTSYISRAGNDHSYFDMGSAYDEIMKKYGYTDKDMFDVFNKRFLDEQIAQKKTFYFSHNPEGDPGALGNELKYIIGKGYDYDNKTLTALPR